MGPCEEPPVIGSLGFLQILYIGGMREGGREGGRESKGNLCSNNWTTTSMAKQSFSFIVYTHYNFCPGVFYNPHLPFTPVNCVSVFMDGFCLLLIIMVYT